MSKKSKEQKISNQSMIASFILTVFNSIITIIGIIWVAKSPNVVTIPVLFIFAFSLQAVATGTALIHYKKAEPKYRIFAIISVIPILIVLAALPFILMATAASD